MNECMIRIHRTGEAGVLTAERVDLPPPAAGEVRVRHHYAGVNFVDVYQRTGLYPLSLPAVPGVEAVGVVEAVGDAVTSVRIGDRVVHAGPPVGSYATARNLSAERVLPLPSDVSDETAAAGFLRGITAHMLFAHVRTPRAGETVLVHAAAGGLGLVLVQWAKSLGLRVIGTVSTAAKAELALAHGLDHAIRYRDEDFVAAVRRLTGAEGVDFAIDGIGGDTLLRTLDAVRPYGMVASIGQVAGTLGPIDPALLGPGRSIAFARPGVLRFMTELRRYREGAQAVLDRMSTGLRVPIDTVLPLTEAAEAHRMLEAGRAHGALLLATEAVR